MTIKSGAVIKSCTAAASAFVYAMIMPAGIPALLVLTGAVAAAGTTLLVDYARTRHGAVDDLRHHDPSLISSSWSAGSPAD